MEKFSGFENQKHCRIEVLNCFLRELLWERNIKIGCFDRLKFQTFSSHDIRSKSLNYWNKQLLKAFSRISIRIAHESSNSSSFFSIKIFEIFFWKIRSRKNHSKFWSYWVLESRTLYLIPPSTDPVIPILFPFFDFRSYSLDLIPPPRNKI